MIVPEQELQMRDKPSQRNHVAADCRDGWSALESEESHWSGAKANVGWINTKCFPGLAGVGM
jgi:hypothetical protein